MIAFNFLFLHFSLGVPIAERRLKR
uniref:Uncharacterized protein n=1 Tax=Rhizophora mucronata TaxID=61149 RepID=A0A2P2PEY5_RHIMU